MSDEYIHELTEADLELHMEVLDSLLNDDNPSDDAYIQLVKDKGGMLKYDSWINNASEQELREEHEAYGITHETEAADTEIQSRAFPNDVINDCKKTFGSWHFSKTYNRTVDGVAQRAFIDGQGRTSMFYVRRTLFGQKFQLQEDSRTCQDNVRDWGGRGKDNGMTDQGGHLVGKALHGHGRRINLTPQNKALRKNLWVDYRF